MSFYDENDEVRLMKYGLELDRQRILTDHSLSRGVLPKEDIDDGMNDKTAPYWLVGLLSGESSSLVSFVQALVDLVQIGELEDAKKHAERFPELFERLIYIYERIAEVEEAKAQQAEIEA